MDMSEINRMKAAVVGIADRIGAAAIDNDWFGCDAVLPLFERMSDEGAVVVVKIDGQRASLKYTVVVSGGPLEKDDFFRCDSATIEEGLAGAIVFYAERCWQY